MITYLLNTLVDSIKTSLINKLGLDPSTEVDLDDFPQLIDDIPIVDSVEELTVTENGTYTGTDGVTYNPVNVNLPLGSKSVTANGTYTASDDSLQGYSSVTVDIDDTDLYRDTTDSTYESVKTLSNCGAFPMLSLTAEINAVQDLHGYDAPWVGGAGKNKFDSDTVLSAFTKNNNKYVGTPSRIVDDYVISGGFKTNTRYTLSYKAYNNTSTPSNFRFIISYTDGTEEIIGFVDTTTEKVIVGTSAENKTISKIKRNYGNGVELTLYDIQLEEGSTATSYAPYSNICPISGWDEVNVSVSGVNIWDEEWESGGLSDANGTETTNTNYVRSDYIPIKGGLGIYGYSNDARQVVAYLYRRDKSYIGLRVITNVSYTTPSDTAFFRIRINNTEGEVSELTKGIVSINYPSTDTEYHAYNGQNYNIDLDGTRYGGTLDVMSGELKVVPYYASYNGETLEGEWISDRDVYAVGTTPTIGAQVVNIGATPTTYQLTPTQVKSLLGTNNLWADTGDVGDVRYFKKVEL